MKFMTLQFIQNLATGLLFFSSFLLYAIFSGMDVPERQGLSKPIGYYLAILPFGILIETFFFQYLPFQLFRLYWKIRGKKSTLSFILISALVFGLYHLKVSGDDVVVSILKVFTTTLAGIILSTSYYILDRKKKYPFWSVFLNHLFYYIIVLGLIVLFT